MIRILPIIGEPAMWEQLAEECTELAKAALKMVRIQRGENPTPITEEDALHNAIEELSDIKACVDELGLEPNEEIIRQKNYRWFKRLKEAVQLTEWEWIP